MALRLRLLLPLFLALPLFAATAPLPKEYLSEDGRTFTSPDGWFTVQAPKGNWEWLQLLDVAKGADPRWPTSANDSVAWLLRERDTGEHFMIMETYSPFADMIDDQYKAAVEAQTAKGIAPAKASNFRVEFVDYPDEKTLRYRYRIDKADGSIGYRFVYATGWQHKVFLEAYTHSKDDTVEPRRFTRMVTTFRWLKQP